jgi:hypothetical protein
MTFQHREELISAFLDGELVPEERAEVEKWLAESPEMRQLLDDLHALRGDIQSLPHQKLDHDLGSAVVRSAERQVLAGEEVASDELRVLWGTSVRRLWSQGAGWRRLAWPALAVAAAILIMVFGAPEPRQVARAPQGEVSIGPAAKSPEAQAAARSNDEAPQSAPLSREDRAGGAGASRNAAALQAGKPSPAAREDSGDQSAVREELRDSADKEAPPADVRLALKMALPAGEPSSTILVEAPADFIRDRALEKLLNERKIAWTSDRGLAGPTSYAAGRAEAASGGSTSEAAAVSADSKARRSYVVEASGEQIDEIILALQKASTRVLRTRVSNAEAADAGKSAAVQRHKIVLKASAAPASEPKDAKDPAP